MTRSTHTSSTSCATLAPSRVLVIAHTRKTGELGILINPDTRLPVSPVYGMRPPVHSGLGCGWEYSVPCTRHCGRCPEASSLQELSVNILSKAECRNASPSSHWGSRHSSVAFRSIFCWPRIYASDICPAYQASPPASIWSRDDCACFSFDLCNVRQEKLHHACRCICGRYHARM